MRIITIANQKGGIGKTTTAVNTAAILSKKGYRTLLVDTDVQCNSTDNYRAIVEDTCTLFDLILAKDACTVEEAIQHTEFGDIIASDPQLEIADAQLSGRADGMFRLRDALENLKDYDFVIIDTNPAVNSMLYNALVASDEVIIPITADRFAVSGLAQLSYTIEAVKKYQNPRLTVAGMLLVKFNERTNINRDVKEALEEMSGELGTKLYKTFIRESVKCRESQIARMPILNYSPKCTTEADYETWIAEELLEV